MASVNARTVLCLSVIFYYDMNKFKIKSENFFFFPLSNPVGFSIMDIGERKQSFTNTF